jgi:hypothetical protein
MVYENLSQKKPSQKGLVERLQVKALSSNPSTAKKKKERKKKMTKLPNATLHVQCNLHQNSNDIHYRD